jgi:hypothetical protein
VIALPIASAINLSRELASGAYRPGQADPRGVVRVCARCALLTDTIAIGRSISGEKKDHLGRG